MIQFLAPEIETNPILPEGESAHCVRVLRHQPGDLIHVVDGKGTRFVCRLLEAHPKRAAVEIVERERVEPYWNAPITIAVAPTKHMDRMEWMTEKLVENGIDALTPLLCRYSERKEIKTERLEKTAVSAMKQSLKAALPRIDDMTPFKKFVEQHRETPQKFIAHCEADKPRTLLSKACDPSLGTVIAIGPEGDFSPEEIAVALEAGFIPVSLGDARLRTETAALSACQTFHVLTQLKS